MVAPESSTIGVYERVQPLGQGGMATVYKAYHPRLNRWVALKMIQPSYTNDRSFIARFEREAQIVAALEHTHIVPIYDFFEHRGKWCMVMKFIDGITLKQALGDGALKMSDITYFMSSIGAALDYAHNEGVLHRDIKPSNILLDIKGTPYLSDFGLAKFAASGEASISQNMLIGTPFYMSPEQGESGREITARSDIYALGIVLYEMLLGRVPYNDGTPYAIIHDHIYKPLPMPSEVDPSISPLLEGVLLTALAKRPEDRYATVKEMTDALKFAMDEISAHGSPRVSLIERHAAAESISQHRTVLVSTSPLPQASNLTNTPIAAGLTGTATEIHPASKTLRRLEIIAVVSFVVIALLVGVIIGARNSNPPAIAAGGNIVQNGSIVPFIVPELSIEDAQANVDAHPNDPAAYLALARALSVADRFQDAEVVLREGSNHTADDISYFAQAAAFSADAHNATAALFTYGAALRLAMGSPTIYDPLRGQAGERLYPLMGEQSAFTPLQIRALSGIRERQSEYQEITITSMIARALVTEGMYAQAAELLNIVFAQDSINPEGLLVRAELEIAQGDTEAARSDLSNLTSGRRAPPWVVQKAAEMLNSLNGG